MSSALRCRGSAGSSPRVRGKLVEGLLQSADGGLIPACAGKTAVFVAEFVDDWAHPRVCGENTSCKRSGLQEVGSSPRVRGKPFVDAPSADRLGLIPACAGKTSLVNTVNTVARAHPRVCGENACQ